MLQRFLEFDPTDKVRVNNISQLKKYLLQKGLVIVLELGKKIYMKLIQETI